MSPLFRSMMACIVVSCVPGMVSDAADAAGGGAANGGAGGATGAGAPDDGGSTGGGGAAGGTGGGGTTAGGGTAGSRQDAGVDPFYGAIAPGTWARISLNTVESVAPCPQDNCSYSAVSGTAAIINDWNGGAFAARAGRLGGLVVWGGGHRGYYGNEVYLFDLGERRWRRVSEPVPSPVCDYAEGELQDGTPCAPHTYDYVDYHPPTHSFVKLGSASDQVMGGCGAPRAHLFSFDTNSWRRGGRNLNPANNSYGCFTMEGAATGYDAARDVFWVYMRYYGDRFAKYVPSADAGAGSWVTYGNSHDVPIESNGAFSPELDALIVLSANFYGEKLTGFDVTNPTVGYDLAYGGATAIMNNAGQPGFEWHPPSRTFIAWAGGATLYRLTPPAGDWRTQAWTWSTVQPASANTVMPAAANSNGTFSRFRWVPALDAFVVVSQTAGDVFLFKMP